MSASAKPSARTQRSRVPERWRVPPRRRRLHRSPLAALAAAALVLTGCAGAEPTVIETPEQSPAKGPSTAAAPEYSGGEDLTDEQRADVEAVIAMLDEYSAAIVDAYADPESGREAIREYVDEPFLETVHSELDEISESGWFMDGQIEVNDIDVEYVETSEVSITACVDSTELRAYSDEALTKEIEYNQVPRARMNLVTAYASNSWKLTNQLLVEEGCDNGG